jgi:hypothetical protein
MMTSKKPIAIPVAVMFALIAMTNMANAQTRSSDWNHNIAVYMLGASLDGQITVGPLTADVNMSMSDVFSNLDMGAMAAYRGEKGRWAVMADMIYMDLGTTVEGPLGFETDVGFDQWLLELDGSYRLSRVTELLFGVRYVGLSGDALFHGPIQDRRVDYDKSWVDPLVGLRFPIPLGKKWTFVGRGDIGGFGIGSEFTWHVLATVRFQVSRTVSLAAGYRLVDFDYEDGEGLSLFKFDMQEGGPGVGVIFSF